MANHFAYEGAAHVRVESEEPPRPGRHAAPDKQHGLEDTIEPEGLPHEEQPDVLEPEELHELEGVPEPEELREVEQLLVGDEQDDPYELDDLEEPGGIPAWLDITITVVVTVVVMLCVRRFVLDAYRVPTGSMLDTIQLGDMLFGEKVSYYVRDPQPGEIVTFEDPAEPEVTLIKRVIATEGQEVNLVGGVVVVDGQALDEPYVEGRPSNPIDHHAEFLDADIAYPYVVPEGCIWVMGDNRTNSLDSRYFGAVPVGNVLARAVFIYWPPSDIGAL